MTINEALTQLEAIKPHQYPDDQLIRWLSNLDSTLWEDVVQWHEGVEDLEPEEYDEETDPETELMARDPYSDLYIKFLIAQIDYHNGDIPRYNNAMIMYNLALKAYEDWLNRNYLPLQSTYIKTRL